MDATGQASKTGIAGFTARRKDAPRATDEAPKSARWQGWQITILGGTVAIGFSLLCNIVMLIVGLTRYDSEKGRGHLAVGSCEAAPKIDTALHVLINILSALLLGASNAAMQCLSAPTRANLDALHAKGDTADIGISGFRNLRFMSPLRRTLWAILLLSSLPLHLLYNSVVTSTITTFRWHGYLVSADFVQDAAWNHTLSNGVHIDQDKLLTLQRLAAAGSLETLSQDDCSQAFSNQYAQTYASVLMVAENIPYQIPPRTGSVLGVFKPTDEGQIDCNNLTYVKRLAVANKDPGSSALGNAIYEAHLVFPPAYWPLLWTPGAHEIPGWADSQGSKAAPVPDLSFVDHCLAERIDNLCTVDTLPSIQGLVVFANLVKLICLLVILFKLRGQPLITIGDAIASYLSRPDETTRDRGIIDMTMSKKERHLVEPRFLSDTSFKRHRWFHGVSKTRWTVTTMMCIGYWLVGVVGLGLLLGTRSSDGSIGSGFTKGEIDGPTYPLGLGAALDSPTAQTVRAIIFANCFQLLLSIAYFQYNGVVTSMLLSREFTNFARDRKALRISVPKGEQRRTFWLSLPYSYSAPLLVLAGLLHWLLSEAIFYQETAILEGDFIFSEISPGSFNTASSGTFLSMEPLFVLLVFAAFCMSVVAALGFRRYAGGIPIVRSNSLAISAACHPRSESSADVMKPIQWGVRGRDSDGTADVGFSSDDVDIVDPTLVQLNAAERALHQFKSGFHSRVMSCFRWKRRRHASDSTDMILMQEPLPQSNNGRNGDFSYAPLNTAYDPDGRRPFM